MGLVPTKFMNFYLKYIFYFSYNSSNSRLQVHHCSPMKTFSMLIIYKLKSSFFTDLPYRILSKWLKILAESLLIRFVINLIVMENWKTNNIFYWIIIIKKLLYNIIYSIFNFYSNRHFNWVAYSKLFDKSIEVYWG